MLDPLDQCVENVRLEWTAGREAARAATTAAIEGHVPSDHLEFLHDRGGSLRADSTLRALAELITMLNEHAYLLAIPEADAASVLDMEIRAWAHSVVALRDVSSARIHAEFELDCWDEVAFEERCARMLAAPYTSALVTVAALKVLLRGCSEQPTELLRRLVARCGSA